MPGIQDGFNVVRDLAGGSGVNVGRGLRSTFIEAMRIGLGAVAMIALVALVIGGIMYIFSAGDENKAKTAKNVILFTVIGLLIIGLAALVVNAVVSGFSSKAV